MANMTFTIAQQEVASQLGLDYTDTNTATLIKRWLNLAYNDIVGYYNWQWLRDVETITMQKDNTGAAADLNVTASVSSASDAVTMSGVVAVSQAGRYIQFSSANDWYLISAHTAGTAAMTISPVYAQADDLTAGTFTIRTRYYSLASTTDKVYSARQAVTNTPLKIIPAYNYDNNVTYTDNTGSPYALYMWKQDSSQNWEITPFPFPDTAMLIELRIKKKVTELSADSGIPIFPDRFESVWLDQATARGWKHDDDDRAATTFTMVQRNLERLKVQDMADLGRVLVLKSIDEGRQNRALVPFPDSFGSDL